MNIPHSWVETTLSTVCDAILGQSPPGSAYNDNRNGLPFFQGKAEFGALYPTARKWTTEGNKRAQPGDVLVSVRAPVGPTNLAPFECVIGRGLAALRPTAVTTTRFVLYQIRATEDRLASIATGSTFSAISGDQLRNHGFVLPPLPEQERIVEAIEEQFSRLDTAEQLLRSARRRADRMRAAALAAVTPADCKWTTLGEIAEIVGGVTKDSKRQSDPSFVEMPYLRVANVQRGYLDLREVTTIRVSPEKAKALRLEPGDILFNEGGDRDKLGRGWIWQGEIDDCIHQNHVFRARLLTNDADPKYVSLHGNTFGQQWFEKMGKQTTNLASINLKTLKSFPVPDLPAEEQHRIVAEVERRLTILESLSAAIDHALTRSDHLRRSILESAFTGELVPHVPDDEPAFELLARIASDHRKTAKPRRRQRA
jgi:type I restriction enzyme S subunit